MPAGAPEMTAEAIPARRIAEGVAVEAGPIEGTEAVKILRRELIVRELGMRHGVRKCPMRGSGPDRRAGTDRARSADEIVAADGAMHSRRIGKPTIGYGIAVAGNPMSGEAVRSRCMEGTSTASSEACAAHPHAAAAGMKASTASVKAATASMKAATASMKAATAGVEATAAAMSAAATAAVTTTTAAAVAG
jgi:hypothetical protein